MDKYKGLIMINTYNLYIVNVSINNLKFSSAF